MKFSSVKLKYIHDERGVVLVTAIAFSFVISLLGITYFRMGGLEGGIVKNRECYTQALYCADAGIEYARYKMSNPAHLTNGWTDSGIDVGGIGTTEATVIYSATTSSGTITAIGTVCNITRTVVCEFDASIIPSWWKENGGVGALTGPSKLNGTMNVDGRDHERTFPYDFIPYSGTRVLATEALYGEIVVQAGVSFGGTSIDGTDYPEGAGDSLLTWADVPDDILLTSITVPDTPDEVVGLNDGTLYQMALENGKLYTASTIPADNADFQLKAGVNYVELPDDYEWSQPNFLPAPGNAGSVMVIHSENNSSIMKLMRGTMPGLFIVDEVDKIQGTIVGALVTLSTADMHLGNGQGKFYYCQDILQEVWWDFFANNPGNIDTNDWDVDVDLSSWKEI